MGPGCNCLTSQFFTRSCAAFWQGNIAVLWIFGDYVAGEMGQPALLAYLPVCRLSVGACPVSAAEIPVSLCLWSAHRCHRGVMGAYLLLFSPKGPRYILLILIIFFRSSDSRMDHC